MIQGIDSVLLGRKPWGLYTCEAVTVTCYYHMCIHDLCIIITTNWKVHLHIWMVARVGLMRLQH